MPDKKFAGFWIRFLARHIDTTLIMILFWMLNYFFILLPLSLIKTIILIGVLNLVIYSSYEIFLTSRYGATLGKLLLKIKTVDEKGKNLSIIDSAQRYFLKWLSSLIFYIGHLMIAFDDKKRGLHDRIAGTSVIKNNKSQISDRTKNITITLSILVIVAYLMFQIYSASLGFIIAGKIEEGSEGSMLGISDVKSLCSSELPFYFDTCIASYSEKHGINYEFEEHMQLCQMIKAGSVKTGCILNLASYYENESLCYHTGSVFQIKTCEKTYDFVKSFSNFLSPKVEDKFSQEYLENGFDIFSKKYPNAIWDELLVNQTRTYTLNGIDYEVKPYYVDGVKAQFIINDAITKVMTLNQTDTLPDGTKIMVAGFNSYYVGYVDFYLGKK